MRCYTPMSCRERRARDSHPRSKICRPVRRSTWLDVGTESWKGCTGVYVFDSFGRLHASHWCCDLVHCRQGGGDWNDADVVNGFLMLNPFCCLLQVVQL